MEKAAEGKGVGREDTVFQKVIFPSEMSWVWIAPPELVKE